MLGLPGRGVAGITGDSPGKLSDNATISGYIRDSETGETLVGATVQLKETRQGTVSNKSGFYALSEIKPGKYTVVFSFLGFEKKEMNIELKKQESRRIDVELGSEALQLEEVVVESSRMDDKRQISVSRINIPIRQISKLRVGGEADVFRSLQYLPGVLSSSQISSGLYIRGGSPDQTLVCSTDLRSTIPHICSVSFPPLIPTPSRTWI